ncbi:MAG TPA: Crp/Fnr family transcriptional regulator [Burkholderiaceae bacterium]|jgi:CRP/FNR family transcriptional regulator, cyclic AMP receptor protein|nr:Crp/Fnr family transcriptional regulator [Burkholderiaceae bacterium]HPH14612.1 Crp/Fnr family transcriptional regulator [Burkholderiaceae bacterium]
MPAPLFTAAQEKQLAALSPRLRALASRGVLRNYRKNTIIITENDPGDTMFVLVQGRVKAYSSDVDGRELTYGTIDAGDYFGEMSLDGGPRSASVITLEPCVCAVIDRAEVRAYLAEAPDFAMTLINEVIRRARAATESARSMALLNVYGRVVALLESYGGPAKAGMPVLIFPVTHQDLASRVGASREMVSRLLKDLEKGEYVKLGVKRITLLKKLPARW